MLYTVNQNTTNPPSSNTGGKSLYSEVNPQDQSHLATIDWLAFTFKIYPGEHAPLPWIQRQLVEIFSLPDIQLGLSGRGWNGYDHRVDLGHYGLLAFGGSAQRDTYHIELNAHGCSLVVDWDKVKTWGESIGARISRSDLAHDDYEGKTVNIQQAQDWYEQGGFTNSGRPPKRQLIDDFDSGDGKTLYVGNRKSGKLCRFYEKGRQLGDKLSSWVRVELELRSKSREIPWDVVVNPGRYLAGAYPCLNFLSAIQYRINTIQKAVNITYTQMVEWLRRSAGKALSVMLQVNGGDCSAVLSQLVRHGRPKRLQDFDPFDIDELIEPPLELMGVPF